MAMSSNANIIVDPDGDLILLLNTTTPDPSKSIDTLSTDNSACNTPDTETFSDADVKKRASLESEISTSESNLIYHDRILVSSKHMSLASPVFKAMIKGESQEGITLRATGKLELSLPDDNPPAMKILMNIIHGRMNSVPLKIGLELFTQLAILVDKYKCREVMGLFPNVWKNELSITLSGSSWANIARWICIAWQFELHTEFNKATQIIREQSSFSLQRLMKDFEYDLPIPKSVADELELYRLEGIQKAVKILKNTLTKYESGIANCNPSAVSHVVYDFGKLIGPDPSSYRVDCDSMVLGSLIKSAVSSGLYPLPRWPFVSWSLKSVTAKVDLLKADSLCFKLSRIQADKHNVTKNIRDSIEAINRSGMDLAACKKLALC